MIFMVDVEEGITALDKSVANLLRRSKKPVMLVVNKVDNHDRMHSSSEFYGLGFDKMFTVSSASGSGTGDLLDEVVANLPPVDENAEEVEKERLPRIAIVGRPNVGKSSLVNALLGEERNIVTEIAGTTRDTIDTLYNGYGHKFLLIDTAGIRRKAKVKEDIEFYSVMRSVKAIEDCDIVVLVIDATVGIDSQDINLVHLAETNSKGLVVLVNKWDLVEKDHKTSTEFEKVVRKKLEPFTDVPIVFTSALTKQRIHKAIEMAMLVYENRTRKIPTRKLNDVMLAHIEAYQPPAIKGKYVKIKFITQLPGQSPKFAFFCNLPQYINDSYKRYLENKMRESFDLHGVPITIFMRKK
jgi:GTP-binding protein